MFEAWLINCLIFCHLCMHLNLVFFAYPETWLSSHIYDSEIFPSNFVVYRKDRSSRGGGVLIAINSLFHSSLIYSPPHLEVISVRLGIKQDIVLCTVYIPPSSNELYFNTLINYLSDLVSSY